MKREILNKWLAELRNPENKQTIGHLNVPGEGRCCLGVLCDVVGVPSEPHVKSDGTVAPALSYKFGNGNVSAHDMPPQDWLERIGLINTYKKVDGSGYEYLARKDIAEKLAAMNDEGNPFDTIATRIEEYVDDKEITVED